MQHKSTVHVDSTQRKAELVWSKHTWYYQHKESKSGTSSWWNPAHVISATRSSGRFCLGVFILKDAHILELVNSIRMNGSCLLIRCWAASVYFLGNWFTSDINTSDNLLRVKKKGKKPKKKHSEDWHSDNHYWTFSFQYRKLYHPNLIEIKKWQIMPCNI